MTTDYIEKFVNALACDLEEGGFRQVSGTTLRRSLTEAVSAALPLLADTGITASQPAELAEQQGVELPPLPPVDGYDKRVQGHYSATQMRDYAHATMATLRIAPQGRPFSSLPIDKMARDLLEQHTVAVPVAVEDGRQFMVREQDALDAIRAALAATGKQQVGEVQGGADMQALAASIAEVAHRLSTHMPHLSEWADRARDCKKASGVLAALAARQPAAQEPVAVVGSDFTLLWAGSGPIAPIVERHGLKRGSLLYAAPPAQGIDLSGWELVERDGGIMVKRIGVASTICHADEEDANGPEGVLLYLLAKQVIDQRDAAPGVGNG